MTEENKIKLFEAGLITKYGSIENFLIQTWENAKHEAITEYIGGNIKNNLANAICDIIKAE